MKAMVLVEPLSPLQLADLPRPSPGTGSSVAAVAACAVCRTDLHVVDSKLPGPKVPLAPGHEIVGRMVELGAEVTRFQLGDRVGIPWLGWTCGHCGFCRTQRENLCDVARFTGYTLDGGYAQFTVADARFCFPVPASSRTHDSVHELRPHRGCQKTGAHRPRTLDNH